VTSEAPDGRDLRPLVVAGVTAVLSLALVLAAARWGWLGPDVGRGDGFCEAARASWIRQPANTWSNLAFVIAGLAVAWYAGDRLRLARGAWRCTRPRATSVGTSTCSACSS
jgi:hypothetical protein